jgi:hypothetical protein
VPEALEEDERPVGDLRGRRFHRPRIDPQVVLASDEGDRAGHVCQQRPHVVCTPADQVAVGDDRVLPAVHAGDELGPVRVHVAPDDRPRTQMGPIGARRGGAVLELAFQRVQLDPARPGLGAHRHRRGQPLAVPGREVLRDLPADRAADRHRPADVEPVEHGDRPVGVRPEVAHRAVRRRLGVPVAGQVRHQQAVAQLAQRRERMPPLHAALPGGVHEQQGEAVGLVRHDVLDEADPAVDEQVVGVDHAVTSMRSAAAASVRAASTMISSALVSRRYS